MTSHLRATLRSGAVAFLLATAITGYAQEVRLEAVGVRGGFSESPHFHQAELFMNADLP
jgi:hypothetical protein